MILRLPLFPLLAACSTALSAPSAPENLALGKSYRLIPEPNYGLSKGPSDLTDLTNGKRSAPADGSHDIWTTQENVGWITRRPALIIVDLGSIEPISGFSFSTVGGRATVHVPDHVAILVSDNGEEWYDAGSLSERSPHQPSKMPPGEPGESSQRFSYTSHDYQTSGRYVAFQPQARNSPFVMCDEVEIYRGTPEMRERDRGPIVANSVKAIDAYLDQYYTRVGIVERLRTDESHLRKQIEAAPLATIQKEALLATLPKEGNWELPQIGDPRSFRTLLPYPGTHTTLMAARGQLWSALGVPAFFIEKRHRFEYADWQRTPTPSPTPTLEVAMLKGEVRSDAITFGNASGEAYPISLRFAPSEAAKKLGSALKITPISWTDTAQLLPVADAIVGDEAATGEGTELTYLLPAGTTSNWWLSVDSSHTPSGTYKVELEVRASGTTHRIPCIVTISESRAARSRMLMGMWDYIDNGGQYGFTRKNIASAKGLMRSHGVNVAWGSRAMLPQPSANDFDAEGNYTGTREFPLLKEWLEELWPDARRYRIYMHCGKDFLGTSYTAPEFAPKVEAWYRVVADAFRSHGVDPSQVDLLLVDEIHTKEMNEIALAWTRPIRKAAPFGILNDPNWPEPHEAPVQEIFEESTILMPLVSQYLKGSPKMRDFYHRLTGQPERMLEFYACAGPARIACPSRYYRLTAWLTFQRGGQGISFWSMGDTGGYPNSWNDYLFKLIPFTPAFIEEERVLNSVHAEALREASQDFELLSMLAERATPGSPLEAPHAAIRKEIEPLVTDAAHSSIFIAKGNWFHTFPHQRLDDIRLKVLSLLTPEND